MSSLFSTAYLPPVSYIAAMLASQEHARAELPPSGGGGALERHENYIKQTYRNRALVCTPQGLHPLIIPVEHKDLYKKPIHEIKISYDAPWQKIHWRTLTSAYRNSPYFEFFEDELAPFYENKFETLFEFNTELLKKIFSILNLKIEFSFTTEYSKEKETGDGGRGTVEEDFRNHFTPHQRNTLPSYYQVFSERNGFISDLSIVDLIFNKGKESLAYLASLPK